MEADSSSSQNDNTPTELTYEEVLAKHQEKDTSKVVVRFRAIGNAPILKQSFYKITASNKFQTVIQFLRKELKYQGTDPLFLYINSAFAPTPDETVASLYKCFNTDGHLIVNYSVTAAWG
ncbi:APG12-domain-containing protein [Radiomyces spectabilis]|uniref:APG12-domain-containing protein n=1 Tax=Radiomyces spectabilis TaxID=64574 RepID=UPI00221ED9AD|nr:APG12-domain-containing protein [Radiomyces spectabilis]KAI8367605.1 APG12-domain-containing protein [Radiomyces spectabilis]